MAELSLKKLLRRRNELGSVLDAMLEILGQDIAVSYTHLRAHETVLDLVCRLLLEKKKHYNTTSNYAR